MRAMGMGERKRIMELYARGWSTRRISQAVGRSEPGVRRIRQRFRERGDLSPRPRGPGRPPKVQPEARQRLGELVRAQPDATLRELRAQSGLGVSLSTIDRHLRKLGLSFKNK